jgi:hypothetical protein
MKRMSRRAVGWISENVTGVYEKNKASKRVGVEKENRVPPDNSQSNK